MPSRPTVAQEADELIHGDRQKDYGHPSVNFERIASAWNAYLIDRRDVPFTALDVANMMILVKAMRNAEGYKRDSAVDIVGYAALAAVLAEDDEL